MEEQASKNDATSPRGAKITASVGGIVHVFSAQCRRRSVGAGGGERSPRIDQCVSTSVTTACVTARWCMPSRLVNGVKSFTDLTLDNRAVMFGWQCWHE